MKLAAYRNRIKKLTPTSLRTELKKWDLKSSKLEATAVNRPGGGGAFTEEERKSLKRIDAFRQAAAQELRVKLSTRREKNRESLNNGDPNASLSGLGSPSKVGKVKDQWLDDPKKGFKNPREFLLDVMLVCSGVKQTTPQMNYLRSKSGKLEAAVGSDEHSTFSDPHGGFLLPTAFTPATLRIDYEASDFTSQVGMNNRLASLTTRVPLNATKVPFNAVVDENHTTSVAGGIIVSRRAEAASRDPSRMQFKQVELNASMLWGTAIATEELLQDSPQSFVALLEQAFATAFAGQGLEERLHGNGIGRPLGVLHANNPCLISIDRVGATNRIKGADILNMIKRCWGYNQAVWLANMDAMNDIESLHIVGDSSAGILKMTGDSMINGEFVQTIKGRPLYYTEYMPSIASASCLLLANFSQYLEGVYQAPRSAESVHVRFDTHERVFKYWLRNDGRPWWTTTLTPKRGSNTLSPFVTLNNNTVA